MVNQCLESERKDVVNQCFEFACALAHHGRVLGEAERDPLVPCHVVGRNVEGDHVGDAVVGPGEVEAASPCRA